METATRKAAQVTLAKAQALREKTNVSIRLCRKALFESCGDAAVAEVWLRQHNPNQPIQKLRS